MEVAALLLLLLLNPLDSGSAQVALTVDPERSQFFKYERFSVSCEEEEKEGEQREEEATRWQVMKRTTDGEVSPCSSSCSINAAFPTTDTGVYWCQTDLGETSNSVHITVTAGFVILESPVLPVTEGDNVTLSCRCRFTTSVFNVTADFYKDGVLIGTSSTGNMTLHSVFTRDQGLYRCEIRVIGVSPESWLTVRGEDAQEQDHPLVSPIPPVHSVPSVPPVPLLSAVTLVRHLLVGTPYLLSTIILGLICKDRARVQHTCGTRQTSNSVIMEITT